jgi:hypothetical protein
MSSPHEGEAPLVIKSRGRFCVAALSLIGAAGWGAVVLFALSRMETGGVSGLDMRAAAAAGLCGVLINAFAFAAQVYGKRAEFDASAREVVISRLIGERAVMDFGAAARLAPVAWDTCFSSRAAYCVVPAASPIYGPRVVTGFFPSVGPQADNFRVSTIPMLERAMGITPRAPSRSSGPLPEAPRSYVRAGGSLGKDFSRRFIWRTAFRAVACVAFSALIAAAVRFSGVNGISLASTRAVACVPPFYWFVGALFGEQWAVFLDMDKKTVRERRGVFGWRAADYSFASVSSFEVTWRGSSLDPRRAIALVSSEARLPIVMNHAARANRETAAETRFLAAAFGLDASLDIKYRRLSANILTELFGGPSL